MSFPAVQKHPRFRSNVPVDVVAGSDLRQLPLENISMGGVFIRTPHPVPQGTPLRLRIHGDTPLGLFGRVVHVIDEQSAAAKSHPPGMGVQFEGLSEQSLQMLHRFVDGLAEQVQRDRARRTAVRFVSPDTVQVRVERALIGDLWEQGLKNGALFAEGAAPSFGAQVRIVIGPIELLGEVVHVSDHGAGLQVTNLDGGKRQALTRFADGTADTLVFREAKPLGPPLGKVLAAVRRLFTGIEESDGFGAIGLPPTAAEPEVKTRVEGLRRVFAAHPVDATPPQIARIEAATRALNRLEPVLLARVAAIRREAELACMPAATPQISRVHEVKQLLADAAVHEAKGERPQAKRLLVRALELAPEHDGARRRLGFINEQLDLARAIDLISKAEVFIQGIGMTADAVTLAREAARLTQVREVRLRAMRVLAKCGEHDDAVLLAEELVDSDAKDPHALHALMVLHEKGRDYRAAARAGEALLRLRPSDVDLQKRVRKIIDNVRR